MMSERRKKLEESIKRFKEMQAAAKKRAKELKEKA